MKIVFMGTPGFAVEVLDKIVKSKNEVVGVVTAVDKLTGRGRKLSESAVKKYALKHQLNILQPINLKSSDFIGALEKLSADLFIVVAFRMLPKQVWQMPKLGTFNLHASLLPDYRGAAPIHWAIINGETRTGVTTFFVDDKIDTGHILLQREVEISPDETAGKLHDRLMYIGADLVLETIERIRDKSITPEPQNMSITKKKAHKIFKDTCRINWSDHIEHIYNMIRGLSPHPCAFTVLRMQIEKRELQVKIFKAKWHKKKHNEPFGSILLDKKVLKIAAKEGFLEVLEAQIEGRKRLIIKDLLNGFPLNKEDIFIY